MTSIVIYGVSMISMYTVSTVYHALKPNGGKKVMRILDHCFVYILIIGSYAPFTLAGIGGTTGILLFSAVIALGAMGIVLTAIDMKRFSKFCFTCYLLMGWIIILDIKPLINSLDGIGLFLLVSGGIVYTVGAVFYGLGKKVKYIHSLWHFFVLAGTALQFLSIYSSVIK